jgi:hypothetical protein
MEGRSTANNLKQKINKKNVEIPIIYAAFNSKNNIIIMQWSCYSSLNSETNTESFK